LAFIRIRQSAGSVKAALRFRSPASGLRANAISKARSTRPTGSGPTASSTRAAKYFACSLTKSSLSSVSACNAVVETARRSQDDWNTGVSITERNGTSSWRREKT
jgi:hypothetical protein